MSKTQKNLEKQTNMWKQNCQRNWQNCHKQKTNLKKMSQTTNCQKKWQNCHKDKTNFKKMSKRKTLKNKSKCEKKSERNWQNCHKQNQI